ncbi:unnamed protein product [Meganyctiphanes norvegica]|uniref:3-hydroxy-3-methylglutaryl coenzyme A reductase n=1 Tax=Meganyctiphanes norvegica TaxID=48144 RepID=A0AAV2R7L7_MEGNR
MVEEEKPNPVVQRVKVIMSAGLLLVHGITRWTYSISASTFDPMALQLNSTTDPHIIVRWLNSGLDHVVFMVMLLALVVKYVLFESRGHLEEHLIHDSLVANRQNLHENTNGDNTTGKTGLKSLSVLRQRKRSRTISYNSSGWEEVPLTTVMEQHSKETQTEVTNEHLSIEDTTSESESEKQVMPRSIEECIAIMNSEVGVKSLTNKELVRMVETRNFPGYKLETALGDPLRAVSVRRAVVAPNTACKSSFDSLPYDHYDYSKVMGVCCENVIGYIPVPVGVAGPLLMNGKKFMVPMATTEGCLVASTNRGCRALVNGTRSQVIRDAMTRAPSVRMPTAERATVVYMWVRKKENFQIIKTGFDSTSRFARLQDLHVGIAGRLLYMRFMAQTGDAMGMNMVSKGTEAGLSALKKYFPDLEVLSVSGNYCMDKKPSAINWIEGRGKSVVCESFVPGKVVTSVLKTSVQALVEANITKNLVGSSLAGSIGGNNAHAANIVAALYIACGQDPAQVVGSSNCMTLMEACGDNNQDLHITVTMPSLEVGTVGGGTALGPQAACLTMLGVKGPHKEHPGENACQLAKIIAATVLAGELSLMAALTAGHLVKAHLQHNRGKASGSTLDSSSTTATCDSAAAITTVNRKSGDTTYDSVANGNSSGKTDDTICDSATAISNSSNKIDNTTCDSDASSSDNSKRKTGHKSNVSATVNSNNSNKNVISIFQNSNQLGSTDNLDVTSSAAVRVAACMDAANLNVPHTDDIANS